MKQFLIDLFNTFGLGINGNVNNIRLSKVSGYFPNYRFDVKRVSDVLTKVVVSNSQTNGLFEIIYKTTEKGRIMSIDINC